VCICFVIARARVCTEKDIGDDDDDDVVAVVTGQGERERERNDPVIGMYFVYTRAYVYNNNNNNNIRNNVRSTHSEDPSPPCTHARTRGTECIRTGVSVLV